ncbi:1-deoxy-D-xylulose 5-phosphate reductoisomerase [bioreactor metagenome]|uniref:1-deoxy-D-xylulose-5-phosphate reductoisomerase n=1 Tax=bioreactor metagenome TaxID=1076179 RepID=A0A645C9L6_9ZZZZ
MDEERARDLRIAVADTGTRVLSGIEGICDAVSESGAELVVNAIVGNAGIKPMLRAIEAKKDIAAANKESIVSAGDYIIEKAKENGVKIIPVDSEHSAIFQCMSGGFNDRRFAKRLIITASGGPFYGKKRSELVDVTPEQAVNHPTWIMGRKISVDSATLMNKALELIEASRLFAMPHEKIDVTIHRQSTVHSFVEFTDNSILCQMGYPDMAQCIRFALFYPERTEDSGLCRPIDFTKPMTLTFEPPDEETFSFVKLARRALEKGGAACAVMSAADEEAVKLFLGKRIKFTDIFSLVETVFNKLSDLPLNTIEELTTAEDAARAEAAALAGIRIY